MLVETDGEGQIFLGLEVIASLLVGEGGVVVTHEQVVMVVLFA